MDPFAPLVVPGFLTGADIGAIDAFGWRIAGNAMGPPAPPLLDLPGPDATGVSETPTFTWTPGSGSAVSDLYVFIGSDFDESDQVFAATDIAGGTVTIPVGVLSAGTSYVWFVTAVNEVGLAYSHSRLFSTASASCAADFNHDGVVDPDDLADFVACYFASPLCGQADVNGNSIVDPDDLADFIAVYFAGCS